MLMLPALLLERMGMGLVAERVVAGGCRVIGRKGSRGVGVGGRRRSGKRGGGGSWKSVEGEIVIFT